VVLKVDPNEEKISLGMKQIEEDPWLSLPMQYPTGTVLSGKVRNLTSFGAFVEIEPGIDGLVHVSDMSWTRRVEHPSEIVEKGEDVQVMVLDIDSDQKRISLGIKQLLDDPWPEIVQRFAPGVELEGKVIRIQDKGVVVDLGDQIEGFVPSSRSLVDESGRLEEYYRAGEAVNLRILESDAANRRIVLEVTTLPERQELPEPPEPTEEVAAEAVAVEPTGEAESLEETAPVVTEAAVSAEAAHTGTIEETVVEEEAAEES
jgi:small subunit ribosomal protein S1